MKSIFLMLVSILYALFPGSVQAGKAAADTPPDTIFVSHTETTYLLFPEDVLLVDIGRTGEYFARIEGRSVFLKARDRQAGPTNMLVRFGQAYFTVRLVYSDLPEQHLYRLGEEATRPEMAAEEQGSSRILDRLHRLKEESAGGLVRQRRKHALHLRITHLQHDEQAIYLGLQLSNGSSVDYKTDFAGFRFEEKRGRRFSRNNTYNKEVRPFAAIAPEVIPGQGEAAMFYALPLYAMTSRGRLRILLQEKDGARVLKLSVPARLINQSPLITQGHEN